MAGIAKIISKTIDDVAKIAGKVLIGLGDAAVGDVLSPKTFYAGDTTLKTGTMPTVAIVAANDNYPEGYHAGDVGGLDAIEANLAPGNIKNGVTIFGKLGTFLSTLTYDTEDMDVSGEGTRNTSWRNFQTDAAFGPDAGSAVLSKIINLAQASVVHGGGGGGFFVFRIACVTKLSIMIDGVMQAESADISTDQEFHPWFVMGHKSCSSGNRTVSLYAYDYDLGQTQAMRHMAGVFACADKVV